MFITFLLHTEKCGRQLLLISFLIIFQQQVEDYLRLICENVFMMDVCPIRVITHRSSVLNNGINIADASSHRNAVSVAEQSQNGIATRGLYWMDLENLNSGQMTRTALELAPRSSYFRTTPAEGRLTQIRFNVHQGNKHDGPSYGILFGTWNPPAPKPRPYY
ncbi:hypothetical protein AVEN_65084-1 [Araneus ventricosus]|uniref:Uncharacterized protein n=1 Tax=Araneus ventricosus TaxID=182803 RepID=A0A4Y2FAC4_ARAVE|nr:hypothetical protein AVEN_65084-1 [Araneus ventricosus]